MNFVSITIPIVVACVLYNTKIQANTDTVCPGEHEEYKNCSTYCHLTCEKPDDYSCRPNCYTGCGCEKTYIRNHLGKCVPMNTCIACQPIDSANVDFTCVRLGKEIPCDQLMPDGTEITGKCKPNLYSYEPINFTITCRRGRWSRYLPYCVPLDYCKPLENSKTIDIKCFDSNNEKVLCNDPIAPGTRVVLECKEHYCTDDPLPRDIRCTNASWTRPIPECFLEDPEPAIFY